VDGGAFVHPDLMLIINDVLDPLTKPVKVQCWYYCLKSSLSIWSCEK